MEAETRNTREAWLERAITVFRPQFADVGFPLPDLIHVSVGFAYGARQESPMVMGQCWRREASDDGANHIFISPELGDTFDVLETLLHELIHAADNCENGHKGTFKVAALALGLKSPMTNTPSSTAVEAELLVIAAELGEYPHGALHPNSKVLVATVANPEGTTVKMQSGPTKQGTRLVKLVCPTCGYTVRTTRKWLNQGIPSCYDGTEMRED